MICGLLGGKRIVKYAPADYPIKENRQTIGKYKIFTPRSYGAGEGFPHQILGESVLGGINSLCTETYLMISAFATRQEAANVLSYINTKFFRFLVSIVKNTQDAPQRVYKLVPMQDFSESWSDEKLYAKYGLTAEEIAFIEKMIKPMGGAAKAERDRKNV